MILFLTGYTGGFGRVNGERAACEFNRNNCFFDLLKEKLPTDIKCLILPSDPNEYEYNDTTVSILKDGLALDGFRVDRVDMCDNRNAEAIIHRIHDYNLLFLGGGHLPTQIDFFSRINLKTFITKYEGVIVGRSAGAMSCADVVYAPPEIDGEAIDTNYKKYLRGLGLTDINILPHFEYIKDTVLDGLDVLNDILLPDSIVRHFYAITDETFIYSENGQSVIFGEAYLFQNGRFDKICDNKACIAI